ncbi:MFS transporter [Roseinatronobacter bogoriensis]|uniref:MFS transporter n=1 Tax=Roseinatronobacter bogoriensis subsp. barguzinensis TaxID=441209 RepID=A0A2K8KDP6_9RHOB|nr:MULTISPECIES: MFS transporter [Rhodobaca]ATX67564.1 MFS transporter [Rhodobaca barguzinensis]MBB4209091.1 UMF1 family MFS transporter [Rhodobaca bogoriensis DSM 18756]TDW36381.1 UMF1 family MFS transporter [Rhodobaca barguzinensis]TDY67491.1 UMF1 family MFS transporter [Rhodobaca bogoriensis DSM 18756]
MEQKRKRVWGWWMFDWANQPYNILLLTFIFAPYFTSFVATDPVKGQAMWGWMLAIAGVLTALCAPVLGAIADSSGAKKRWILLWSCLYVAGSTMLWWAVPEADEGRLILILVAFAIGMVGLEYGIVFTNALLPTLGTREEWGKISGTGWALGYIGGLISLFIMLLLLAENDRGVTLLGIAPILGLDPEMREGTRAVGPFTALWYMVFVIPFFLWVKEPAQPKATAGAIRRGLTELKVSLRALPGRRSLLAYLGSSMVYRDALNGIYAFGGIYAAGVLEWSIIQIGVFGILAAAVGALSCWLTGKLDSRFGPKPVIVSAIALLIVVCTVIISTDRTMVLFSPVVAGSNLPDIVFYICGALIGAGGGSLQAASRTMMVRQANPDRMTEGFGLYALSGKVVSFIAPALIALTTTLTGSQRLGVTPLIVLFVIGLILLLWVKAEGEPEFECASPSSP